MDAPVKPAHDNSGPVVGGHRLTNSLDRIAVVGTRG
jgi:hypothetical protein